MNNEIITIKQLPVIEEHLQVIKAEVIAKTQDALSLECNEKTVKEVKKVRTDLNKDFKALEERRKAVKKAVMTPYEAFEAVYKECITDIFKNADSELKGKIGSVENSLKEKKATEVFEYFNEYLQSKGIDFVTFENAHINVTLSASKKSLKEQAKTFIDRVCDDLALIDTQEHKDEILYHYKKVDGMTFLNASKAITLVNEKFKAIEEAKAREEERKAREQAKAEAVAKVEAVAPPVAVTSPAVEPIAPPVEEEKTFKMTFTVKGTMAQLKELKKFIIEKGIEIE